MINHDILVILAEYMSSHKLHKLLQLCDNSDEEYLYSWRRGNKRVENNIYYNKYVISYENGCIRIKGEKYYRISKYKGADMISSMRYMLDKNDALYRCFNMLYYATEKYGCMYYIDSGLVIYNLKYNREYSRLLKVNVIIRDNKYTIDAITGEIIVKRIDRMAKIQRFPAKFNTYL